MDEKIDNELNISIKKCFSHIFSDKVVRTSKNRSLIDIIDKNKGKDSVYNYPYGIFWKITSKCNLRCKHCFFSTRQQEFDCKNDLAGEELLKLAEFFIDELNIISFTITGGEPLLQKNFFELLKYLKSKNVYIQIQTNATLITEEIARDLARILNHKSDTIQVSLEGVSQKTHDQIRGNGNFKKTTAGIKHLTNNGLNVIISYTATSANVAEIPSLYKLSKALKIKEIIIGRFKICSEEQAYLKPNLNKLFISLAKLIDEIGEDNSVRIKLTLLKAFDFTTYEVGRKLLDEYLKLNDIVCSKSLMCHNHEKATIWANGKVYLCADTEKDELCLGDLKKQSFFEIWKNRFNNVFFQERSLEKSVCKKCKYVSLCSAGCPAKSYFEYGDINSPDSECIYGKILIKKQEKEGKNYVR